MTHPDAARAEVIQLLASCEYGLVSWDLIARQDQQRFERMADALLAFVQQREGALKDMIERKNTALARPCINCGYEPKVIAATHPDRSA